MRSNLKMVLKSHLTVLKTVFPIIRQNCITDFTTTQRQTFTESFLVQVEKRFFRFGLQFHASFQL